MSFKAKLVPVVVAFATILLPYSAVVQAAEWKSEPSINFRTQYNDNVRMRAEEKNPEASTGFTLEPRIKFAGEEQRLWDVSIDTVAKITRFQDIEDGDSENLFFVFDGGKQTERTDWRLNARYRRNTNFDTDFNTENPDAGILDDRTERTTVSISPSVSWSTSEISQIKFSLNNTDISFDEVSSNRYRDSDTSTAEFVAYWLVAENHQLGFTTSYTESDTPEVEFTYDQTVIQLDYTYTINQLSKLSFSLGGRRLNSLSKNATVACDGGGNVFPPTAGECPESIPFGPFVIPVTPVIDDISSEDDGTVINLSYSNKTELASHSFSGGRSVIPSSFGGAQEVRNANYQFSLKNTERLTTKLILAASESSTISGTSLSFSNDRTRYRVEPSVSYRLTKNWNLQFLYRYIQQDFVDSNRDSTSNAVYVNLYLHWPRLVTTY